MLRLSDFLLKLQDVMVEVNKLILYESNVFQYLLDECVKVGVGDSITLPTLFFNLLIFLHNLTLFPTFSEMLP